MRTFMASLQWMLFILMGSIVVPVAIAGIYGFDPQATVAFVSRTLFVLGIAGILQVLFGHRLPITEGPAGVWWGVFALYAGVGSVMFGSTTETLRVLEFSFILSGIIFIILSLFGLIDKIARLFTPTVMGVYLVLMVIQLSGSFLQGMMGLDGESSSINPTVMILSIVTIAAAYLSKRVKALKSYTILISIAVGWILFVIFGQANAVTKVDSLFSLPKLFAFGTPRFELGMVANIVCLTLLLLTNLMASVKAVQVAFETLGKKADNRLKETGFISGIIHILAGAFGSIGPVPISGSAAFITQTKETSKKPFIIGNLFIILISLSPVITSFFAALPPAVGYAALVPTFGVGTIMIALNQFEVEKHLPHRTLTAAASWFVGVGVMFIPASAFDGMSPLLISLLSNGLIVGTVVAVVIDVTMRKRNNKQKVGENS